MEPAILLVEPGLRLRRFDPDAAGPAMLALILGWYVDLDTVRLLEGPDAEPYDAERLLRMLRYLRDHGELYLIELADDRGGWLPIGDVTLQSAAIPILVCREARGRGIGRAVIRALIDRARALDWPAVNVSDIYTGNRASRRLFTALGFRPVAATELGHRYRLELRPLPDSP